MSARKGNSDSSEKTENDKDPLWVVEQFSKATHVADLWAGYGSVQSLQATMVMADEDEDEDNENDKKKRKQKKEEATRAQRSTLSWIVKVVQPPQQQQRPSESHERKLKSYQVEAAFYRCVVPQIMAQQQRHGVVATTKLGMPRAYWIQTPAKGNHDREEEDYHAVVLSNEAKSRLAQRLGLSALSTKTQAFCFCLSDLRVDYPVVGAHMRRGLNLTQTHLALTWLARFHALFWQRQCQKGGIEVPEGTVWRQGTYWYLATRQSEWQTSLSSYSASDKDEACWHLLARAAPAIDERLQQPCTVTTLVHGDFKQANLLFPQEQTSCAAVDFQYTGWGCGMKDVVKLLVSSVEPKVVIGNEEPLLRYYCARLEEQLQIQSTPTDDGGDSPLYPWSTAWAHYELCLLDYLRFLSGWGWWGLNLEAYAQPRARQILQEWQQDRRALGNKNNNGASSEEDIWRQVVKKRYPVDLENT